MRSHRIYIALFLTFLLVMFGLNHCNNSRLQNRLVNEVIQRISTLELNELHKYFTQIEETLTLVSDLGKDILLGKTAEPVMNSMFFPFITHHEDIESIILADNKGNEYFITRKENNWQTRTTSSTVKKGVIYREWDETSSLIQSWTDEKVYSPETRPWFNSAENATAIAWTPVYRFFHSGKKGVTCSKALRKKDGNIRTIFAIDITLDGIRQILNTLNTRKNAILFLSGPDNRYIAYALPESFPRDIDDHTSFFEDLFDHSLESWIKSKKKEKAVLHFNAYNTDWASIYLPFGNKSGQFLGMILPIEAIEDPLKVAFWGFDLFEITLTVTTLLGIILLLWKSGLLQKQSTSITPENSFHRYREAGEGERVEFKSTIRTNLKSGKRGKEIEFAWLKSITAFLNSNGGALLLGVNDSAEIMGLEADEFENEDKCLLHLKNLINHHIGANHSHKIAIQTLHIEEKLVVLIECTKATEPVFLVIGKNEEFYIRTGPSSTKLTPSQIVSYVKNDT